MECEEIKREELLEKYLAEKLEPGLRDGLETHVLECSACARELEMLLIASSEVAANEVAIRNATFQKPAFAPWKIFVFACLPVALITGVFLSYHSGMSGKTSGSFTSTTQAPKQEGPQSATSDKRESSIVSGARSRSNAFSTPPAGTKTAISPSRKGAEPANPPSRTTESNSTGEVSKDHGQGETQVAESMPSNAVDDLNSSVDPGPFVKATPPNEPTPASGAGSDATELTTAQAVELYRLGHMEAPPFTFTGFSGNSHHAAQLSSLPQKGAMTDTDRKAFREAMNAYVAGDYNLAGNLLEEAAKKEPTAPDVQFYVGVCRLLNGNPQGAIEPLQRARAARVGSLQQSAHYYLAKAYLQSKNLGDAERELEITAQMPGPLKEDSGALLSQLRTLRSQLQPH